MEEAFLFSESKRYDVKGKSYFDSPNKYYCEDGHKRLSALSDILKEDPSYKRGDKVTVIIENSSNVRSNDCWRGRNTH